MPELEPARIVEILNRHAVDYVIIGGVAAELHDLPIPATVDLDVTPARDSDNLAKLADAFEELEANLNTADDAGTWFPRHPVENWAQYDTLHLMTRYGSLDIVFTPDGAADGYHDLSADSVDIELEDQTVAVISIASWVRLKQASGRLKDLNHLLAYESGQAPNKPSDGM